jgi:sulfatase maturation enzyme AslB (radical SAM superfamily)
MAELEYGVSKAIYHTDKIKGLQEGKMIVPLGIQLDLEAYCNDNCEFCSYRKEDAHNNMMLELIDAQPGKKYHENKPIGKPSAKSRLPLEMAETLPRQIKAAGIKSCELTGGGEPTLWPAFDTMYENLGLNGIDIGLVTNGSKISDKRAELIRKYGTWCRVSMDAATQDTHKKLHRTANEDFARRIENIKKLTTDKPDSLTVGISFIINQDNFHEIEAASKLYSELGVDHLRFSWMFDKNGDSGLTKEQREKCKQQITDCQTKYDTDIFKVFTEPGRVDLYGMPNDFDRCYYQHFIFCAGADAKLYPCCIQKYFPGYDFADLTKRTLKEIIEDINTKEFMENLDPRKCENCWLRNRNNSMAQAIQKPKHHNFI